MRNTAVPCSLVPLFPASKKWAARVTPCRRPSLGCLEVIAMVLNLYCKSLVTSCCTLLACASAEMPVWLRISYFDIFDVADA